MLLTCLHSRNDWRRLCFRYDLYIHTSCTVQSLVVYRCVWPLWSSLHVIFSNPENELDGKAKERHVRTMLLACLLAKQCLCTEDVRHVTRKQPRIRKKQQRREKFLHVGGNLCALLLTWPLDRHCAIITRDCSAKRKRKKERESELRRRSAA